MKCLAVRHVAFEDLGLFEPVLRQRGCAAEYVQAGVQPLAHADWDSADLVIVLGGPIGVGDQADYPWLVDEIAAIRRRLDSARPLLGLCLGAQLMASALGAKVFAGSKKEIGWAPISLSPAGVGSPLRHLAGLDVLHWHGDTFDLPRGAVRLASTALTPNQAFSVGPAALAIQFHVEVEGRNIEPWLIGHALELRQVHVDIGALRQASAAQGRLGALAAAKLFDEWLDTFSWQQ